MPLADIELSIDGSELPGDVLEFLREANSRVDRFVSSTPVSGAGFVPSNFATVYRALRAIAEANLAPGNSFCEWGSGFGVAASLAAMLGFDACGIEIDKVLVDASRKLADDFGLPVEFVHGSFIPPGEEARAEEAYAAGGDGFFWLVTNADDAYDDLGLGPDDFDVVFTYSWPNEEPLVETLFEKHAAVGALLLTHNLHESVRLQRKVSSRVRSRQG